MDAQLQRIARKIAEMAPDGTVLHKHIARLVTNGPHLACRLPGSSTSSHTIAFALAVREDQVSIPRGTCANLLSALQAEADDAATR